MSETATRPFVGPDGLADRWAVDKKTILSGINRGEIPCTKIGRRWLIPLAWIEAQEDGGRDPP